MIALIRADPRTLPPKPADPLRPAAVRTPRPIAPDACFHEAVSRLLIPEAAKEILVHNNLSQYSTLLLPWLGRCKPCASASICQATCGGIATQFAEQAHSNPEPDCL